MKKFYCVTSSFDNQGRVTAAIKDCVMAPHARNVQPPRGAGG